MKYHKIDLNVIYHHIIPPEHLTFPKEVIKSITGLLVEHWVQKKGLKHWPNLSILQEVNWKPKVARGSGFVSEFAKLVKAKLDLNLTSDVTHKIGNIVGVNTTDDYEYCFSFTNKFNWKAGEFGDAPSCFWQNRKDIRTAMENEGNFYAIQFFKKYPKGTVIYEGSLSSKNRKVTYDQDEQFDYYGMARSWLYETQIKVKKGSTSIIVPVIIIFNSYGLVIQTQSLVLASFLNKDRSHVRLSNKERTSGGLYVNGPGYMIGDYNLISSVNRFDFGLENTYDRDTGSGEPVHERIPLRVQSGNSKMTPRELRLFKQKFERAKRRSLTQQYDWDRKILNQRFAENLTSKFNMNRYMSNRTFSDITMRGVYLRIKPTELPIEEKIAKERQYNPMKVINHYVINNKIGDI